MTIETYRGVEINLTAEVLGFNVGARDKFCFTLRYRSEDDAPIIDMFPTVDAARREIDEAWEAEFGLKRWSPYAVETVAGEGEVR